MEMAERVGFEPTVPVKVQQFSRLPDSTTLAPLREALIIKGRTQKYQASLDLASAAVLAPERSSRLSFVLLVRVVLVFRGPWFWI